MSKIFTRTFRVRWSEMDASGQVSPASALRYLVETAFDWGETLGLGEVVTEAHGISWLIRETELHLLRPLKYKEVFDFTIWMVNWQRVRGTRCFEMRLQDGGELIAWGTQQIACMDRATQRPTTMPEGIIANFRLEDPRVLPYEKFPRVTSPVSLFKSRRIVEWHDLDAMEHVNNGVYVTYAQEAAAQELAALGWPPARLASAGLAINIQRVHIQYHSPAVWGEQLSISTHMLSRQPAGGSRYANIIRADGSAVAECILDWSLVERISGAEKPLPEELANKLAG